MSTHWTLPQQGAIEDRGGSLLLSAAAGSGKTAVLVERVVGLLSDKENPVDVTSLLIVTFSNAAAAEMRQRIGQRLGQMIQEDPSNYYLHKQHHLVSSAPIQTIHAFCMNLIREYFQELSISPDFSIMDEKELNLLKAEVVAECIEEFYEQDDTGEFAQLVELISSTRDDSRLGETVFKVYNFARSHPFYEDWLDRMAQLYDTTQKVEETIWGRTLVEYALETLGYSKRQLEDSKELLLGDEVLEKAYLPSWESDLAQINNILDDLEQGRWDAAVYGLRKFDFQRLGAVRGEDSAKVQAKQARDLVKELITPLSSRYLSTTEKEFRQDLEELQPKVFLLFALVKEFGRRLTQEKLRLKKMDFSDLEHYALQLLVLKTEEGYVATSHAVEIGNRFREVLVDEYQDTNEVQDLIFTSLSGGGQRLFMVGDVKQSIYSFRLAMPEIFMEKKKRFFEYHPDFPQYPATIHLDTNFRSRKEVTETVNDIFSQIMSPAVGEIEYNETERLKCGRDYPVYQEANPEFYLIDGETYQGEKDDTQLEAEFVAGKIKELLESGYQVTDGDHMRPATLRDFCILMRSPSGRAETYLKALEQVGLTGVADRTGGFLKSREISIVVSFLMVLDNPLLDVELAAVLLSPMWGFTPDKLAEIRLHSPGVSLYHGVVRRAEEGDEDCKEFLGHFRHLGFYASHHSADELLREMYRLTYWMELVRAMPFGEGRQNNLLLLVQYANHYDNAGYKGLSGFVALLRRILETGGDLEGATPIGEGANVVEILSIHRSKGLEFPVVILADMGRRFNKRDLYEPTLLHSRYGFATKGRNRETLVQYPTVPMGAIQLEMQKTLLSEEMRILYVALTRAKEKLILTSTVGKGLQRYLERQYMEQTEKGTLPSFRVGEANSYSDWVTMVLLHHPSGQPLRDAGDLAVETFLESQVSWKVEVVSPEEAEEQGTEEIPDWKATVDEELKQELENRLSFVYPHQEDTLVPTKLAVSDVVAQQEREQFLFTRRPRFITKQVLTPAQRGNALHKFMQFANYENAKTDLKRELVRMEKDEYLSSVEVESLDSKKIQNFFESSVADRIFASPKVYRELRFITQFGKDKLEGILDQVGNESQVVVQGVADCVFIENGEAVIVDYKTDRVASLDQLVEYYQNQIFLYKEILEDTLELPVKEGILYSFQLSDWIDVLALT